MNEQKVYSMLFGLFINLFLLVHLDMLSLPFLPIFVICIPIPILYSATNDLIILLFHISIMFVLVVLLSSCSVLLFRPPPGAVCSSSASRMSFLPTSRISGPRASSHRISWKSRIVLQRSSLTEASLIHAPPHITMLSGNLTP